MRARSAGGVVDAESMRRLAVAFARSVTMPEGQLCRVCVEVLDVSGAGITLMGGDQTGPLCVSNGLVQALEDFQFTSGEGPCRDAFAMRAPVLADRMDDEASRRWPLFANLAVASGIGGAFAYPMSSDGATVGVMTLYQHDTGVLSTRQHDDSMVLAEIIGAALLSLQADAPEGALATGLEDAATYRAQVHQASGMVAVQLGVSAVDALARMRAFAFANDLAIDAVATEIITRQLRLDDDRPQPEEEGA